MATDLVQNNFSYPASADLSTKQFYGVKVNTGGAVEVVGDGGEADGILYNKPTAAGQAAEIALGPVVKAKAGAALATTGIDCGFDADGLLVTATTGESVFGKNLETASGAGVVVSVLRTYGPRVVPA